MTYAMYGHRHKALVRGQVRSERHFGGGAKSPPQTQPAPQSTDPEIEKEKQRSRQAIARRRGRRATILTGGQDLAEPATVRGSLTAPGSVQRLGG